MSATRERLRARSRWSAAARCPRWAALGLLGAEPAEPDDRTKGLWARGRLFEGLVANKIAAKYGEENIVRQKEVPWPAGELHTDIFLRPEKRAIEVKSAVSLQAEDAMWLQLAGEVYFDGEAEEGALWLIDPVDLGERVLPFLMTDEWAERVEEVAAQVVRAGKTDELPDCVACSPTECHFRGCPYTETAWEGWTPPPPGELSEEDAALVTELYRLEREIDRAEDVVAEHEQQREALRAQLRPRLAAGGLYVIPDALQLKRVEVKGRTTYDVPSAIEGGVLTETLMKPFRKTGNGHDRWYFKRIGEAPLPSEDFGEEAPF